MPRILCAPLYKGLVHADDRESIALVTRRNTATGEEIPLEQYIELVADAREEHPELVQDVVRATTAALLAQSHRMQSRQPLLASVEGCEQTVGGVRMTGGAIMESIWRNVVPPALMQELPLYIDHVSRCTIEEIRVLLAIPGIEEIRGITHAYHEKRTARMMREEAGDHLALGVSTPEEIVAYHSMRNPHTNFVRDLVAAGGPTEAFNKKEQTMEAAYAPLHACSRIGEKLTFGAFNLEIALADRIRKRAEKKHSQSGTHT